MKKRKGDPWMTAAEYGRALAGFSVNLIVRDIDVSLAFYRDVIGFKVLYSDPDFAALQRDGIRVQLHADHTYEGMPWAPRLAMAEKRGLGTELRILGIDPDAVERAARAGGFAVLVPTRERGHGWREVIVEDRDGYVWAVGVPA